MKSLPIYSSVFALAVASALPAEARGSGSVALRLEYYELDHGTLNALVAKPTDSMDAGALRQSVLDLVLAGEATQVESTYLVTKSGQRARVESVIEWISPIGYDPPEVPGKVAGPIFAGVDLMSFLTPTAFVTENIGLTFEADPVVGPGAEIIDLNLAPQLAVYLGDNTHGQDESTVHHPVFHTLEDHLSIAVRRGHWAILSIHSPPPNSIELQPARDRRVFTLLLAEFVDFMTGENDRGEASEPESAPPTDPFAANPAEPEIPAGDLALSAEWFELDASEATRLLDQHPGSGADATELRKTLGNWVANERATLFESAYLVTKSGQRAKSESAQEWIYPIEVTVGGGPQNLVGPIDPGTRLVSRVSYSAYETRDLGTIFEVDPVVGPDGISVDINVAAEIAEFGTNIAIGQGRSSVEMPILYSMKTQTSVAARSGVPLVLSQHSPRPADVTKPHFGSERRILCILTTRVLSAE